MTRLSSGLVIIRGRHVPALQSMLMLHGHRWYILPTWIAGEYWRLTERTWAAVVRECMDHPGYPTKRDARAALAHSPLHFRSKFQTIWRVHELPARIALSLEEGTSNGNAPDGGTPEAAPVGSGAGNDSA